MDGNRQLSVYWNFGWFYIQSHREKTCTDRTKNGNAINIGLWRKESAEKGMKRLIEQIQVLL